MNAFRGCWLILFCCPAAAAAQIVTVPQPLAKAAVPCASSTPACETVAQTLSRHLAVSDSSTLHRYAWEVLQTLSTDSTFGHGSTLGDLKRNYYRFVWVDDEYADGDPVIRTLLVHLDHVPESAPSLPGIGSSSAPQLIDIFVSDDPGAVLQTQYFSTRLEDPVRKQLPAFVQASGLVGFVAGSLGRARGEAAVPETTFTIARASLPLQRASVTIRDTVITPGSAVALREAAGALRERLVLREARASVCAQTLAAADAAAIAAGVTAGACAAGPNQPAGLNARQAGACRDELIDRLEESYRTTAAACQETPPDAGSDPLIAVDARFTELVESLRQTRRSAESDLVNQPRNRFTLGLFSGAKLGAPTEFGSTVRVRVGDNGTIVQDPLPTMINMAVVNIHPWPYEPEQGPIRWEERFRFVAGTVVSPDFGVGGGAGVMIMRGLAVNAGWAMLFVNSPKEGFALGDTVPAGLDPLRVGRAGVFFAGASYSFR
jgi:hypothetical protein